MKEGKIMQINNRQEDLTKVFDRTWKANHNDDVNHPDRLVMPQ